MAVGTGVFHPGSWNQTYIKSTFELRSAEIRLCSSGYCSNEIFIFFGDFKARWRPCRPFSCGIQTCKTAADKETSAITSSLSVTKLLSTKGYSNFLNWIDITR